MMYDSNTYEELFQKAMTTAELAKERLKAEYLRERTEEEEKQFQHDRLRTPEALAQSFEVDYQLRAAINWNVARDVSRAEERYTIDQLIEPGLEAGKNEDE